MSRRVPLREPVGVAPETLRAHKMRSFLTLLGIILSVSTLIIVIALISDLNRYIAERVANLGSNVFLLTRFPIITDVDEYVKANRRNRKVTWDDYESLHNGASPPGRKIEDGDTQNFPLTSNRTRPICSTVSSNEHFVIDMRLSRAIYKVPSAVENNHKL